MKPCRLNRSSRTE